MPEPVPVVEPEPIEEPEDVGPVNLEIEPEKPKKERKQRKKKVVEDSSSAHTHIDPVMAMLGIGGTTKYAHGGGQD